MSTALASPLTAAPAKTPAPVRLLAYVHLRNIHNATGAGRVARQLVEHLHARADIDLEILADARDRERCAPLAGPPWDRLRYRTFAEDTSRRQLGWYLTGRPRAEHFRPDAEVVWAAAESYVPTRRARAVVTLHDAAYFEQGAHARDWAFVKQQLKWRLLFGRLARTADLFHTVSAFSAERLAHFFPAMAARLRVVHNAVAPVFFNPVEAEGLHFLAARGLDRRPFVLIPGGLHYRKNAELLLRAAPLLRARLPEHRLVVANHSDPRYAARASAVGLELLGFVPDAALRALYGAAAAVWFPSRYEGFGLPVLEAMACGAPVAASRAAALPEIAGGCAVLLGPDAAGEHVDALVELCAGGALSAELRAAGLRHAARFTWARAAGEMAGLFGGLR